MSRRKRLGNSVSRFYSHIISIYISLINKTYSIKSIATFLILCLVLQSAVYAAPVFVKPSFGINSNLPISLKLPSSIASIEDHYKAPNSDKTIILIQDAHTNESGQLNISTTLDHIFKQQKISNIFLEAGSGNLSLSDLRNLAPLKKRRQVGLKYIKKGLLQGSEYFDLTTKHEFKLWGVEDMRLYEESLAIYREVLKQRDAFKVYLSKIKSTTEFLKTKIYNPQLQQFDAFRLSYVNQELSLIDYLSALEAYQESRLFHFTRNDKAHVIARSAQQRRGNLKTSYPTLHKLQKLHTLEASIDFDAANIEYEDFRSLIDTPGIANTNAPVIASGSVAISSSNGRMSSAKHYSPQNTTHSQEMNLKGLDLKNKQYPNLTQYKQYIQQTKNLNVDNILSELKDLEDKVESQLSHNQDEVNLSTISKNLTVLSNLIELQLQPEQYQRLISMHQTFELQTITGFLNLKILELKAHQERAIFMQEDLEQTAQLSKRFYDLTRKRDEAFVGQALQKMDKDEDKQAILITGGFHTAHLKIELKDRGISFISIRPSITSQTNHTHYEKLLTSQYPIASTMALKPSAQLGAHLPKSRLATILKQEDESTRSIHASRMGREIFEITDEEVIESNLDVVNARSERNSSFYQATAALVLMNLALFTYIGASALYMMNNFRPVDIILIAFFNGLIVGVNMFVSQKLVDIIKQRNQTYITAYNSVATKLNAEFKNDAWMQDVERVYESIGFTVPKAFSIAIFITMIFYSMAVANLNPIANQVMIRTKLLIALSTIALSAYITKRTLAKLNQKYSNESAEDEEAPRMTLTGDLFEAKNALRIENSDGEFVYRISVISIDPIQKKVKYQIEHADGTVSKHAFLRQKRKYTIPRLNIQLSIVNFDNLNSGFARIDVQTRARHTVHIESTVDTYTEYYSSVLELLDIVGADDLTARSMALTNLLTQQAGVELREEGNRILKPVELIVGHLIKSDFLPTRSESVNAFFRALPETEFKRMIGLIIQSASNRVSANTVIEANPDITKHTELIKRLYTQSTNAFKNLTHQKIDSIKSATHAEDPKAIYATHLHEILKRPRMTALVVDKGLGENVQQAEIVALTVIPSHDYNEPKSRMSNSVKLKQVADPSSLHEVVNIPDSSNFNFGRDGIVGKNWQLSDDRIIILTTGFLQYLEMTKQLFNGQSIVIGGDHDRKSTSKILNAIAWAITNYESVTNKDGPMALGVDYQDAPIPALVKYAADENNPSIFVAAESYFPGSMNGLRFYTQNGIPNRSMERDIEKRIDIFRRDGVYWEDHLLVDFDDKGLLKKVSSQILGAPSNNAYQSLLTNYKRLFSNTTMLTKKKIILTTTGSSTSAEFMKDILTHLGAEIIELDWSKTGLTDDFKRASDLDLHESFLKEYAGFYAMIGISPNGESAFIIDENGRLYRGDGLGIAATSTSLMDIDRLTVLASTNSDGTRTFVREAGREYQVTSPYAPDMAGGMKAIMDQSDDIILTTGIMPDGGVIVANSAHPSMPFMVRDGITPLLLVLTEGTSASISNQFEGMPNVTGRIQLWKQGTPEQIHQIYEFVKMNNSRRRGGMYYGKSQIFMMNQKGQVVSSQNFESLLGSKAMQMKLVIEGLFNSANNCADNTCFVIERINYADGIRIRFTNGSIAHIRSSTNPFYANVYVYAKTNAEAESLVDSMIRPNGILDLLAYETFLEPDIFIDSGLNYRKFSYENTLRRPNRVKRSLKHAESISAPKLPSDYLPLIEAFLKDDIDDKFMKETFKNLFGLDFERKNIMFISIDYVGSGNVKNGFKITMYDKDGSVFRFVIKVTHPHLDDDVQGYFMSSTRARKVWAREKTTPAQVLKFGSHADIVLGDNVGLSFVSEEYLGSRTLESVMTDPLTPILDKIHAVSRAYQAYSDFSKMGTMGELSDPKPANIMQRPLQDEDWVIIDVDTIGRGPLFFGYAAGHSSYAESMDAVAIRFIRTMVNDSKELQLELKLRQREIRKVYLTKMRYHFRQLSKSNDVIDDWVNTVHKYLFDEGVIDQDQKLLIIKLMFQKRWSDLHSLLFKDPVDSKASGEEADIQLDTLLASLNSLPSNWDRLHVPESTEWLEMLSPNKRLKLSLNQLTGEFIIQTSKDEVEFKKVVFWKPGESFRVFDPNSLRSLSIPIYPKNLIQSLQVNGSKLILSIDSLTPMKYIHINRMLNNYELSHLEAHIANLLSVSGVDIEVHKSRMTQDMPEQQSTYSDWARVNQLARELREAMRAFRGKINQKPMVLSINYFNDLANEIAFYLEGSSRNEVLDSASADLIRKNLLEIPQLFKPFLDGLEGEALSTAIREVQQRLEIENATLISDTQFIHDLPLFDATFAGHLRQYTDTITNMTTELIEIVGRLEEGDNNPIGSRTVMTQSSIMDEIRGFSDWTELAAHLKKTYFKPMQSFGNKPEWSDTEVLSLVSALTNMDFTNHVIDISGAYDMHIMVPTIIGLALRWKGPQIKSSAIAILKEFAISHLNSPIILIRREAANALLQLGKEHHEYISEILSDKDVQRAFFHQFDQINNEKMAPLDSQTFRSFLEYLLNSSAIEESKKRIKEWIPTIVQKMTEFSDIAYYLNKKTYSTGYLLRLIEMNPQAFNNPELLDVLTTLSKKAGIGDFGTDHWITIQTIAEEVEKAGATFNHSIYAEFQGHEERIANTKQWAVEDQDASQEYQDKIERFIANIPKPSKKPDRLSRMTDPLLDAFVRIDDKGKLIVEVTPESQPHNDWIGMDTTPTPIRINADFILDLLETNFNSIPNGIQRDEIIQFMSKRELPLPGNRLIRSASSIKTEIGNALSYLVDQGKLYVPSIFRIQKPTYFLAIDTQTPTSLTENNASSNPTARMTNAWEFTDDLRNALVDNATFDGLYGGYLSFITTTGLRSYPAYKAAHIQTNPNRLYRGMAVTVDMLEDIMTNGMKPKLSKAGFLRLAENPSYALAHISDDPPSAPFVAAVFEVNKDKILWEEKASDFDWGATPGTRFRIGPHAIADIYVLNQLNRTFESLKAFTQPNQGDIEMPRMAEPTTVKIRSKEAALLLAREVILENLALLKSETKYHSLKNGKVDPDYYLTTAFYAFAEALEVLNADDPDLPTLFRHIFPLRVMDQRRVNEAMTRKGYKDKELLRLASARLHAEGTIAPSIEELSAATDLTPDRINEINTVRESGYDIETGHLRSVGEDSRHSTFYREDWSHERIQTWIHAARRNLDEIDIKALKLYLLDRMPIKDIAIELGTPVATTGIMIKKSIAVMKAVNDWEGAQKEDLFLDIQTVTDIMEQPIASNGMSAAELLEYIINNKIPLKFQPSKTASLLTYLITLLKVAEITEGFYQWHGVVEGDRREPRNIYWTPNQATLEVRTQSHYQRLTKANAETIMQRLAADFEMRSDGFVALEVHEFIKNNQIELKGLETVATRSIQLARIDKALDILVQRRRLEELTASANLGDKQSKRYRYPIPLDRPNPLQLVRERVTSIEYDVLYQHMMLGKLNVEIASELGLPIAKVRHILLKSKILLNFYRTGQLPSSDLQIADLFKLIDILKVETEQNERWLSIRDIINHIRADSIAMSKPIKDNGGYFAYVETVLEVGVALQYIAHKSEPTPDKKRQKRYFQYKISTNDDRSAIRLNPTHILEPKLDQGFADIPRMAEGPSVEEVDHLVALLSTPLDRDNQRRGRQQSFEKYWAALEFLHEQEILKGNILYPAMGHDIFPSYFSNVIGLNRNTIKLRRFNDSSQAEVIQEFKQSYTWPQKGQGPSVDSWNRNAFDVESYVHDLLKQSPGGVDAIFFKGFGYWTRSAPRWVDAEVKKKAVSQWLAELSHQALKPGGYIVINSAADHYMAETLIRDRGYQDVYKRSPAWSAVGRELITERDVAGDATDHWLHNFDGQIQTIQGHTGMRVIQKPKQPKASVPMTWNMDFQLRSLNQAWLELRPHIASWHLQSDEEREELSVEIIKKMTEFFKEYELFNMVYGTTRSTSDELIANRIANLIALDWRNEENRITEKLHSISRGIWLLFDELITLAQWKMNDDVQIIEPLESGVRGVQSLLDNVSKIKPKSVSLPIVLRYKDKVLMRYWSGSGLQNLQPTLLVNSPPDLVQSRALRDIGQITGVEANITQMTMGQNSSVQTETLNTAYYDLTDEEFNKLTSNPNLFKTTELWIVPTTLLSEWTQQHPDLIPPAYHQMPSFKPRMAQSQSIDIEADIRQWAKAELRSMEVVGIESVGEDKLKWDPLKEPAKRIANRILDMIDETQRGTYKSAFTKIVTNQEKSFNLRELIDPNEVLLRLAYGYLLQFESRRDHLKKLSLTAPNASWAEAHVTDRPPDGPFIVTIFEIDKEQINWEIDQTRFEPGPYPFTEEVITPKAIANIFVLDQKTNQYESLKSYPQGESQPTEARMSQAPIIGQGDDRHIETELRQWAKAELESVEVIDVDPEVDATRNWDPLLEPAERIANRVLGIMDVSTRDAYKDAFKSIISDQEKDSESLNLIDPNEVLLRLAYGYLRAMESRRDHLKQWLSTGTSQLFPVNPADILRLNPESFGSNDAGQGDPGNVAAVVLDAYHATSGLQLISQTPIGMHMTTVLTTGSDWYGRTQFDRLTATKAAIWRRLGSDGVRKDIAELDTVELKFVYGAAETMKRDMDTLAQVYMRTPTAVYDALESAHGIHPTQVRSWFQNIASGGRRLILKTLGEANEHGRAYQEIKDQLLESQWAYEERERIRQKNIQSRSSTIGLDLFRNSMHQPVDVELDAGDLSTEADWLTSLKLGINARDVLNLRDLTPEIGRANTDLAGLDTIIEWLQGYEKDPMGWRDGIRNKKSRMTDVNELDLELAIRQWVKAELASIDVTDMGKAGGDELNWDPLKEPAKRIANRVLDIIDGVERDSYKEAFKGIITNQEKAFNLHELIDPNEVLLRLAYGYLTPLESRRDHLKKLTMAVTTNALKLFGVNARQLDPAILATAADAYSTASELIVSIERSTDSASWLRRNQTEFSAFDEAHWVGERWYGPIQENRFMKLQHDLGLRLGWENFTYIDINDLSEEDRRAVLGAARRVEADVDVLAQVFARTPSAVYETIDDLLRYNWPQVSTWFENIASGGRASIQRTLREARQYLDEFNEMKSALLEEQWAYELKEQLRKERMESRKLDEYLEPNLMHQPVDVDLSLDRYQVESEVDWLAQQIFNIPLGRDFGWSDQSFQISQATKKIDQIKIVLKWLQGYEKDPMGWRHGVQGKTSAAQKKPSRMTDIPDADQDPVVINLDNMRMPERDPRYMDTALMMTSVVTQRAKGEVRQVPEVTWPDDNPQFIVEIGGGHRAYLSTALAEQYSDAQIITVDPAVEADIDTQPNMKIIRELIQDWDDESKVDQVDRFYFNFPAGIDHSRSIAEKVASYLKPETGKFVMVAEGAVDFGILGLVMNLKELGLSVQANVVTHTEATGALPYLVHQLYGGLPSPYDRLIIQATKPSLDNLALHQAKTFTEKREEVYKPQIKGGINYLAELSEDELENLLVEIEGWNQNENQKTYQMSLQERIRTFYKSERQHNTRYGQYYRDQEGRITGLMIVQTYDDLYPMIAGLWADNPEIIQAMMSIFLLESISNDQIRVGAFSKLKDEPYQEFLTNFGFHEFKRHTKEDGQVFGISYMTNIYDIAEKLPEMIPANSAPRLAYVPNNVDMARELLESLRDFSSTEIKEKFKTELSIFLYGLYQANKSYFDGRHSIAIGSSVLSPELSRDDESNLILSLSGFSVGLEEARTIANNHRENEKLLRQQYLQGSAIAYVLEQKELGREYQAFKHNFDRSDIRQSIPKGIQIKSNIFDPSMDRSALEQQLELLIVSLANIHKYAPNVNFYLDPQFIEHQEFINSLLRKHEVHAFISIGEATEDIIVTLDSLSLDVHQGVLVDVGQIQSNELPFGLSDAIYQGLMEAEILTDPETGILNFSKYDPDELTRLRLRRNSNSEEPIESNEAYIEVLSGLASIIVRKTHIWTIARPIPLEYALKAMRRTILEVSRSS